MEELFKMVAARIALAVEASAALIILAGAIEAIYLTVRRVAARRNSIVHKREIWVRFAIWLLLALEFELAADVVRTAISPTWSDIGQLASIAAIRTVLNYFLERDIEAFRETPAPTALPV